MYEIGVDFFFDSRCHWFFHYFRLYHHWHVTICQAIPILQLSVTNEIIFRLIYIEWTKNLLTSITMIDNVDRELLNAFAYTHKHIYIWLSLSATPFPFFYCKICLKKKTTQKSNGRARSYAIYTSAPKKLMLSTCRWYLVLLSSINYASFPCLSSCKCVWHHYSFFLWMSFWAKWQIHTEFIPILNVKWKISNTK